MGVNTAHQDCWLDGGASGVLLVDLCKEVMAGDTPASE